MKSSYEKITRISLINLKPNLTKYLAINQVHVVAPELD